MAEENIVFRDLDGSVEEGIEGMSELDADFETTADMEVEPQEEEIEYEIAEDDEEVEAEKEEEATDDDDEEEATIEDNSLQEALDAAEIAANEREAKLQEQLHEAQTATKMAEYDSYRLAENGLTSDIDAKKAALVQAKEDGETTKEVDLQTEIASLAGKHSQIQQLREGLEDVEGNFIKPEYEKAEPATKPAPAKRAEETINWIEQNASWLYSERTDPAAVKFVTKLSNMKGDKNDPKFYDEMNKKIRREFPELAQKIKASTPKPSKKPKKTATKVASVDNSESSEPTSGKKSSKVRLTKADFANMEDFGLNTKDPEVLREYAKNKIQS